MHWIILDFLKLLIMGQGNEIEDLEKLIHLPTVIGTNVSATH